MVLSPLEFLSLILLLFILIIILKPEILVRFGKSLGEIRREMRRGEVLDEETERVAKTLGIDVSGKSREEVLEEIEKKLKS